MNSELWQHFVDEIRPRYREPWRRYHDERHLDEVLAAADRLAEQRLLVSPRVVRLALLFHDAIYEVPAGPVSNEEASAQLLERMAAGKLEDSMVSEAAGIVRATAAHGRLHATDLTSDGQFALDCDLGILGADAERYLTYEREIREEYSYVPEEIFRAARGRFLEGLLARPAIYFTETFQTNVEERARENLRRALCMLGMLETR
jgi:predicted metal-dependent HD superfamily phosphohydrolase